MTLLALFPMNWNIIGLCFGRVARVTGIMDTATRRQMAMTNGNWNIEETKILQSTVLNFWIEPDKSILAVRCKLREDA